MRRRVVITGIGVVSSIGIGKKEFWGALSKGISGASVIKDFDTSKLETKIAGQVVDFDPYAYIPKPIARKVDRFVHFGLASARLAIEDASLDLEKENKYRVGVVLGSVFGGVLFHEMQIMTGLEKGFNRVNAFSVPKVSTNAVSSHISIMYNALGPNMAISTACASGANAIGQAFRLIQHNSADVIFAGGVEAAVTPITFSAFCNLGLLSRNNEHPEKACRPYDKNRDGFLLGEGGAVLILEELTHAMKRNARIYGEIVGYGNNCGAHHIVTPEPEGEASAIAMLDAIKDSGITPQNIDYVSAYGNATQPNDVAETKALKIVFNSNAYSLPVSSIKSMIGHTAGASGAIEAVSSLMALNKNIIPPTINYETPDPECDLDYVPNVARKARVRTVLLNSFGVGNNNACIVMRKFEE